MVMAPGVSELEWQFSSELSNPFAEAMPPPQTSEEAPINGVGFAPWGESLTPFTDEAAGSTAESQSDRLLAEAFTEIRDEDFDEAVAYLAEETEEAVAGRFTNELPSSGPERERYADAQLSPVRFEAQQYLEALETALTGMDLESMSEEQLDEVVDRFTPQITELSPAGEEFVGALVRKAKKVVKFVANTAKSIGKVAGNFIGPVLKRLRGLIKPLLRRVLSFAIGRLPVALQPAARTLAARFTSEAGEEESLDELPVSPTNLTDVEALAESFDAALAEAMVNDAASEFEGEYLEGMDNEASVESRELELLAEARGLLVDQLGSASDEENVAPAIEQFVPALLMALRVGINLVGRPKVVRFLASYLGQMIRGWVGPTLAPPLSNAIVDTGLRLISLESESGYAGESRTDEAGPVALASVIEDTVRRLAENEDFVYENEDLMQLATAEAFSQAVSTHFPTRFVRPSLHQAPSLGGTFVAHRPRSVRTYRKYSRIPEVEITAQIADALPTFAGSTLGAVLRAAGTTFPVRARLHIYQAAAGTTLQRMVRQDRALVGGGGRGYATASSVHPLTSAAAGLLLREPRLGLDVHPAFLQSRHRIAVGQRFYALEPIGTLAELSVPGSSRAISERLAPSRSWTVINLLRSHITVSLYLSEAEAQGLVGAMRQGRGVPALLKALSAVYQGGENPGVTWPGHFRIIREDGEDFESLTARTRRLLPSGFTGLLRRRLRAWVLPALARWARDNGEAFARATAHPDAGVTIRVRLTSVPGLDLIGQAARAGRGGSIVPGSINALRGTPTIAITVAPGRRKR